MAIKYFTLQEANGWIPVVDQELRALQDLKQRFEQAYLELRRRRDGDDERGGEGGDPFFVMEAELEFMQIEARSLIHSFGMKGIELKDIEIGLVDFPAILNGEEVLLCWRQGEDSIRFYHGRYEGFGGRKPIAE